MIDQIIEVLIEGESKRSVDQWMGKTDILITVVWDKASSEVRPEDLVPATIQRASVTNLFGNPTVYQPESPRSSNHCKRAATVLTGFHLLARIERFLLRK